MFMNSSIQLERRVLMLWPLPMLLVVCSWGFNWLKICFLLLYKEGIEFRGSANYFLVLTQGNIIENKTSTL